VSKVLSDMTVLVTGASRGIGRAIAVRFASLGMNIVINYNENYESANETARLCMQNGGRPITIAADVSSRDEVLRMKAKLDSMGIQPDIVVNNAGISHYGLLQDVNDADWDRVVGINLKGMFLTTQLFSPSMINQKFGRIINVSSIWGETGASCEAIYSMTKGGMNAFTKAMAKELAPSNITVNAVAPGVIQTDMLNPLLPDDQNQLRDEIPAGRFGSPDEIASLVYFLALPESSYLNGQIISPNGGLVT
jgi:3-oxoacyl-[acyl-carrier protein] reductase